MTELQGAEVGRRNIQAEGTAKAKEQNLSLRSLWITSQSLLKLKLGVQKGHSVQSPKARQRSRGDPGRRASSKSEVRGVGPQERKTPALHSLCCLLVLLRAFTQGGLRPHPQPAPAGPLWDSMAGQLPRSSPPTVSQSPGPFLPVQPSLVNHLLNAWVLKLLCTCFH